MLELDYYTKYYYVSFSDHKKRIINISVCVVSVITLLVVVAILHGQSSSPGGLFSQISSSSRIYMKDSSFTEGLVVIEKDDMFYDLLFDYVNLTNMTINVKQLSNVQKINSTAIR